MRGFHTESPLANAAPRPAARYLALSGLTAGLYAALTLSVPVLAYGGIQFRAAEAMTALPWLFPETIPGLAIGCFLVNLLSPFALDCVFGTLATLLAALWTARVRHIWLAPVPPVVCNAVIVGAEIAWYAARDGERFLAAWAFNGMTVGLGEAAACGLLGLLLLRTLTAVLPEARGRLEARTRGTNETWTGDRTEPDTRAGLSIVAEPDTRTGLEERKRGADPTVSADGTPLQTRTELTDGGNEGGRRRAD